MDCGSTHRNSVAGFGDLNEEYGIANVGYWLAPDAVGFGYATRATNLLLRYAIEDVGAHRAEIWISAENEPSRRVAERSLATYEATMRQCLRVGDRNHDAHCFAFVQRDPVT